MKREKTQTPEEEELLLKCLQSTTSGFHLNHTKMNCVIDLIFSDVFQKFPDLKKAGMKDVIAFSNNYASSDGLLKAEFKDWLSDDFNESAYVIGVTTIWISCFLKPNGQNSKVNARNFQICLLAYYFNLILGVLPRRIAVAFEKNTICKHGIYEWTFGSNPLIKQSRGENLLLLLRLCSLSYCPCGAGKFFD